MDNKIELLDTNLLKDTEFETFEYWKKTLAAQVGWHYPLDIVWVLKNIDKLNLPVGSSILDAGGGYGLTQFILAAKGYNVISVDFAPRKPPKPYQILFSIDMTEGKTKSNKYIRHLEILNNTSSTSQKFKFLYKRLIDWNIYNYAKEVFNRSSKGKITFYKSDFSKMKNIDDNSIDLVISVSAIEHNPRRDVIHKSVNEFRRVLKSDMSMLITTSATNKKSWFHKPSKGWCYDKKDLVKYFSLKNYYDNFGDYTRIFSDIRESKYLRNNLPYYYYLTKDCGMPYGKWDPKYIPIGIKKVNV